MLENGYIILPRLFLKEWEWADDANTVAVFLHLLVEADIVANIWHGIEIPRGGTVSSYSKLAEKTGLTIKQVRTAIKHLEQAGCVARTSYSKCTVFTIKNFDLFQAGASNKAGKGQAEDKQRAGKGQQNKKKEEDKEEKEDITVNQVVDLYHEICKSYPRLRGISENRRKAISARCKLYRIEDFRIVFQNAENSGFLKGGNDRNWSANFDWMIKDTNFIKILEGRYNGRSNDTFSVSDSRGHAAADTTESANDGEGLI